MGANKQENGSKYQEVEIFDKQGSYDTVQHYRSNFEYRKKTSIGRVGPCE